MAGKKGSPAVDRALNILEVISQGAAGMTNAQLARRLGIPKSSASNILGILQERGYVCRFPDSGRYKLGYTLLSLGRKVVETSEIRELTLPFMRDLSEKCDLTCHLAILGQGDAVHLEKVVARRYFQADKSRSVGDRVGLHSSSVGKAMLAWRARPVLDSVLGTRDLYRFTSKTVTSRMRLLAQLEQARKQGYTFDDEECRLGWRCVGAPIFDQLGNTMVAICVTGTLSELIDSNIPPATAALKETAQRISRQVAEEQIRFAAY
jgi:IclR family transcriptional regulator, KDG regulon repressor